MRGIALVLSFLVAPLIVSACGSASSSSSPSPQTSAPARTSAPTPASTASTTGPDAALRAAAIAWSHAYLTGTALEQLGLQGPECLSGGPPRLTPADLRAAAAELQRERARLGQHAGLSPATIQSKIEDVSVRNVTTKTAEAEVRYDLPVTVTGNDNWVTYELIDGKWKVQDCHAPFGGSSESSSGSVTP